MCDPRTRPRFIPAPAVGRFAMMYSQPNGDVANNILHIHHKDDAGWSAAQLAAMSVVIGNAWTTNVAPQTASGVTLIGIRGTDEGSETGPSFLQDLSTAGTHTGEMLPGGCTIAIKLSTGNRGRSYRGRIFVPGLCDIRASEDGLDPTYAAALLHGWQAVMTAINGVANCELVVTSYCNAGAWRNPAVSTPVISMDMTDVFIDYQRRRATNHAVHR